MHSPQNPIIFTDLDGTLLDHHDYSFTAALEVLSYIKDRRIPLVIVSSKTESEILDLQKRLGIDEAFVSENGAGVHIPRHSQLSISITDETVDMGHPYQKILDFLTPFKQEMNIRGFHDMTVHEVMELTGLDEYHAHMAMQRGYTEPFILEKESMIDRLKEEAHEQGLDIVQGGRFYHAITQNQDKANALRYLARQYREKLNDNITSIALGDSENDFTMLQASDLSILIPKHDGSFAAFDEKVIKAPYPGPKGWNASLKALLI